MFKSVFVKYLSTFMLINVLSILLSASIITTLVNNYDENARIRALKNVAYESASFMIEDYSGSGETSFADYLNDSVVRILPVLNAMTTNTEDMVIFVTDGEGAVKLVGGSDLAESFAGEDGIVSQAESFSYPASITAEMREKEEISRRDTLDGFFEEEHQIYLRPLTTRDGRVVGSVMACTMTSNMDGLLGSMINTIIVTMLWLMLAALAAIYFITERLVSPLRAMTRAAREFAAGKFDVRVDVSGNDEVAELADGFNKMAGALQNSEETRRLFLANVSHDLRTPMTTIIGFIESIQSGAIPQEMVPHYLEVISSEVKRLSRLVADLLDITKIQAGERKFTMAPFDICRMAREIIVSSEQRLEDRQLDVSFEPDSDNMFVKGDRDAIYQVLYNLCDNAIKFSKQGGRYVVSVHENGSHTEISVYNEGEGISPEDLPHVFDRFYKGDRSRGLDKTGTGLGLYISKTIVEAHSERIWVESEYGRWCRFSFTLPKASARERDAAREKTG